MNPTFFLTDLEGKFLKLQQACQNNPALKLANNRLELQEGWSFVFGGDAVDRGPHSWHIVQLLCDLHDRHPDRVVLLPGNRDINKLRLPRELSGHPPAGAPDLPPTELLKWILTKTMGAGQAWDHALMEAAISPELLPEAFLSVVLPSSPNSCLLQYLSRAKMAYKTGNTLFVHGAVTPENIGIVPGKRKEHDLDAWIDSLQSFLNEQLDAYKANPYGTDHHELIAYQAPLSGTRFNQQSIIYGRHADALGNPVPLKEEVRNILKEQGVCRVVVGHTPAGDAPAIVQEDGTTLVAGDNSYGRLEWGSRIWVLPEETRTEGMVWREGRVALVQSRVGAAGGREETGLFRDGWLNKGYFEDGWLHQFRFVEGFVQEERAVKLT